MDTFESYSARLEKGNTIVKLVIMRHDRDLKDSDGIVSMNAMATWYE
jgi:hypothetical protein